LYLLLIQKPFNLIKSQFPIPKSEIENPKSEIQMSRPQFIEDLRREAQNTTQKQRDRYAERAILSRNPAKDLFHIKPADQWLKEEYSKPEARQLLGTLWHEHELCILFADTNLGKSILAVQIGYCLGKCATLEPFGSQADEALKVLYIDFELSTAQFKARYFDSGHGAHHFGENFIRAEFNPGGDNPVMYDKYEDYVQQHIESAIRQTKVQVLIIDNITCVGGVATQATAALPLIKTLKALKTKHRLSVLVLAHTPKRSLYNPITVNDLQGSKMLINFADSAFAIGQSHQSPGLRYIKQIKQRNSGSDYGANHICLFRIVKQHSFLSFQFEGYDTEAVHLQKPSAGLAPETRQQIHQLRAQGLSIRQIAAHFKIGASTVARVLNKIKDE
jgi:DNA-binding CsgD family transcriptional regulator